MELNKLKKVILMFDSNEIHSACEKIGHPLNWESFEKELNTYSFQDCLNLLEGLIEVIGEQDITDD